MVKPRKKGARVRKNRKKQKGRGIDLVGWASKVLNPPEMHWPGYNYLGPFTRQSKLANNVKPVNALDAIAKAHDAAYGRADKIAKNAAHRKKLKWAADKRMVRQIDRMKNKSIAARVSRTIINLKRKVGL